MAQEFHVKWTCVGQCELSKPCYESRLWNAVSLIADSTGRTFGPTTQMSYKRAIINRFSLAAGNRLFMVDKELHGNYWVDLLNESENEQAVYRLMMANVATRIPDDDNAPFDPYLEMYLWCAINLCDISALTTMLNAKRTVIPPCVMASLLTQGIHLAFEQGVDVLLSLGASAEHNNSRGPLNDVFLAFMRNTNANRTSLTRPVVYRRLTNIMRKLIAAGATLLFDDHRIVCNQRLHWVANLAVADSSAVRVLLEAMPEQALRIPRALILPGVDYDDDAGGEAGDFGGPLASTCSALMSSVYRACQSFNDVRSMPTDWVRIFNFATLPLLQAGAVCDPDPLERRRINRALAVLIEPSIDSNAMKTKFWGRPQAVVDIVLEVRQKTSLDVARLKQCYEFQVPTSSPEQAERVKTFTKIFQAQFPRSLQAICRVAILRSLPVGAKQRQSAIQQLSLPNCLSNYLNFSELQVLPGIFDEQ